MSEQIEAAVEALERTGTEPVDLALARAVNHLIGAVQLLEAKVERLEHAAGMSERRERADPAAYLSSKPRRER